MVFYTYSKNDGISSVRKHYCAVGLELALSELRYKYQDIALPFHSSVILNEC